jgi:hypothetical protein
MAQLALAQLLRRTVKGARPEAIGKNFSPRMRRQVLLVKGVKTMLKAVARRKPRATLFRSDAIGSEKRRVLNFAAFSSGESDSASLDNASPESHFGL